MNPKAITTFLFFLMGASSMILAQSVTFKKTFGNAQNDFGHSVQQTMDGGFILFGLTTNDSSFNYDLYLIKTDYKGEKQWEKKYGDELFQLGNSVQQTIDGGYILCGADNALGNDSLLLIRTDATGNIIWKKKYRMSIDRSAGRFVRQTMDGGFIITGFTGSSFFRDVYVIKTDGAGTMIWNRAYGGSGDEVGVCIRQTFDGGYVVLGETNSYGHGGVDMYMIRMTVNGDTMWTKTFGTAGAETGFSLDLTSDGGFIGLGFNSNRNGDLYLVRTDENGNEIWNKSFGGDSQDNGYSVEQTTDGGYFLAGRKHRGLNQPVDMYVIKTDQEGEMLWDAVYPEGEISEAISAQQTSDGGYILFGSATYLIDQDYTTDMYLVKIDSSGTISGLVDPSDDVSLTICPNPVFETAHIKFKEPLSVPYTFLLYDAQGQLIRNESGQLYQELLFNRDNLAAGVYFFKILSGDRILGKGKVIVL